MAFELRKGVLSDIPSIISVYFDAFGDHPVTTRVFRSRREQAEKYWTELLTAELQDPATHYILLTDPASPDPERVLAFGKWREVLAEASPPPTVSWPEGADLGFVEEFIGTIERKHKELMEDRPHWLLDMLGVRKECQRRGAGQQLVRWGVTKADEARLEAFLAASPAGAPLYAKHGFELRDTSLLDEGRRLESFMVRPAKEG